MSMISMSNLSLTTPIPLPNELLSHIVYQALLSPRLSGATDELFIQPKCKMAFQSLSNGFGISCRRYRAIFLREWFRVFHVQEIDDLEQIINGDSGALKSISVSGFVRELYVHQSLVLRPEHFTPLLNLHTISYPLQPIHTGSNAEGISPSPDRGVGGFPASLQKLELRDANTCSPDELRSLNLSSLVSLTHLRVTCGEEGAWGPIPYYIPTTTTTGGKHSFGKLGRTQTLVRLIESYLTVFSPFKHLRALSLDVHFTDNTLFPPGHFPPNMPLLFAQPQHLNLLQGLFGNGNIAPLLLPPLPIPPPPLPPNPAPPETTPCTGDNSCTSCWEVRVEGTHKRELLAAKMLARGLQHLEAVEWTIWFREPGIGEERKRICIDRALLQREERTDSLLCKTRREPGVKGEIKWDGNDSEEEEDIEDGQDILVNEENASDFVCRTSKVPLALYPAVLG